MNLDSLDTRLLEHFEQWFPRPETLEFCEYDSTMETVQRLCSTSKLHEEPELLYHFASNARLGLVGDWTCFPAFTGYLAVLTRRQPLLSEFDLAFLYLHLSEAGSFGDSERALLREWTGDLLYPWEAEHVSRDDVFYCVEHALDLLGLHVLLGGEAPRAIQANLARAEDAPTHLISALCDFVSPAGVDEVRVREHFSGMLASFDNQDLPEVDAWALAPVKEVLAAVSILSQ